MASVELRDIRKSYDKVEAIRGVSLTIDEGEFVVLVGPSGCGKSTLLRCIAGLEPVTSGKLLLDGVDMTTADPVTRGVAMVFQSYALYPHMTVGENIGFGLKIAGENKSTVEARVIEIAKFLNLRNCWRASRRLCPAGSGNALRLVGRSPGNLGFSCLTNPCPISMRRFAPKCA